MTDTFYPPNYKKADTLAPIIEELSEDIMDTISKALPDDKYMRKEIITNIIDWLKEERRENYTR